MLGGGPKGQSVESASSHRFWILCVPFGLELSCSLEEDAATHELQLTFSQIRNVVLKTSNFKIVTCLVLRVTNICHVRLSVSFRL